MNRARGTLLLVVGVAVLTGCPRDDDQRTDTIRDRDVLEARADLEPEVATALDDANAAYRDRDYETALRHYQSVVEMRDDLAAGWFGIYMAQLALGNAEAAEAAMEQARIRAPGASLMHPDPDAPVPPDHPALPDQNR